jgi:GMP synthase-like glutamine amidotransferase
VNPVLILRFSADDGPGYFAEFLDARKVPWSLVCIDRGEPVPSSLEPFSGLVLMGGPMSVNDELPWIPKVLDLVRLAFEESQPVLGHCLGGQLMSKAQGGVVSVNAVKEIGWQPITPESNDIAREWLGAHAGGAPIKVFQWHGETFSLPPGATRILRGDACANQAFVIGNSLAMQCHVEMQAAMIDAWCDDWAAENVNTSSSVQSVETILAGIATELDAMRKLSDALYGQWLAGVYHHSTQSSSQKRSKVQ